VPAFEFRFALFRLGLFFQFTVVSQKVHEGTGIGSKSTLSLTMGAPATRAFQELLRYDPPGGPIWVLVAFSLACGRHRLWVLTAHGFSACECGPPSAPEKYLSTNLPLRLASGALQLRQFISRFDRFGSGFDFDHAIERVAVPAMERGWLFRGHDKPPFGYWA
jgi:hypothetical protein